MYKAWGKLKEIKELVKLVNNHLTTWHKPKLEVSYLKQLFTRIIWARYSSWGQLLAKVFLCLRMKYARWNISLEKNLCFEVHFNNQPEQTDVIEIKCLC